MVAWRVDGKGGWWRGDASLTHCSGSQYPTDCQGVTIMPLSKVLKKILLSSSTGLIVANSLRKKTWVHTYNLRRQQEGEFVRIYQKLRQHPDKFYLYLRMSVEAFDLLRNLTECNLQRSSTNFREAISAEQRLVITVR